MFESLADHIRHDEHEQMSNRERLALWIVIGVVSVLVFGAVCVGVTMLG